MTIYLCAVGPHGLRHIARLCYHKAHYLAGAIAQLPGWEVGIRDQGPGARGRRPFFNEFVARGPVAPAEVNARLLERGIIGGLDVSDRIPNGLLLCATELNTREEIDTLVTALAELA
jgi:glycine dehydrogenase subunit 1